MKPAKCEFFRRTITIEFLFSKKFVITHEDVLIKSKIIISETVIIIRISFIAKVIHKEEYLFVGIAI